jgi:hypothetical protein
MRSIKKWGRPLAFVAAFALMGMSQVGCGNECEDACNDAFNLCVEEGGLEQECDEFLVLCLEGAGLCDLIL